MSDQQPPQADIVGAVLNNKYEVLARLSQGGMGVVYKARHVILDTAVALKVLLKSEDPEAQNRFRSEARLASKIRHPNTVYISDFGFLPDGRPFLEMEFLDGRTLSAEITRGPIEVLRSCQIAMQIARGLSAVHEKGIIHRDMKPDNVFLLQQDGTKDFVKIVDFGIAKVQTRPDSGKNTPQKQAGVEGGAVEVAPVPAPAPATPTPGAGVHTMDGMVMGTPGFMAPEQISGSRIDARTDQYALGCILYEMIAGEPVFDAADNRAVMMRHITVEPVPLPKRCPNAGVPESVNALVLRLLAKERQGRFPSMREVELALQAEIDQLLIKRGLRPKLSTDALQKLPTKPRLPLRLLIPIGAGLLLMLGTVGYFAVRRMTAEPTAVLPQELVELRHRALAVLSEDVRSAPPELRETALAALGQSRDPELRPELARALGSPDATVRAQAAAALGTLGDRQAIPTLGALLPGEAPKGQSPRSEPPPVQVAAAGALRQLGDSRGERFLVEMLNSKDADLQLRAALALCEPRPPEIVQRVLRAYLQRGDLPQNTVLGILGCLARVGNPAAVARLRQQMEDVGPPEPRLSAAVKLAQNGEASGFAYLRGLLRKRGGEQLVAARELALLDEAEGLPLFRQVVDNQTAQSLLRQIASDGLGALGESSDARRLSTLLGKPGDGDRPLSQSAARAILFIVGRDPSALSAQSLSWARTALGDRNALVRQSAVAILGDDLSKGAVTLLSGMLADKDAGVRRSAVAALGRQKNDEAVVALQGALRDSDISVRESALRALLSLGELLKKSAGAAPQLRQALASFIETGRPQERALSAALLLKMGDAGQSQRLRAWLSDPNPELRRLALEQLPLSADELAAQLKDTAYVVRFLAARKLAELGDERAIPVLREAFAGKGEGALRAAALLRRLGAPPEVPDPIEQQLGDEDPAVRTAAVDALSSLPVAQARSYLARAARDTLASVRVRVAEVAGAILDTPGPGRSEIRGIVQVLANDEDAAVQARARAILARRLPLAVPAPQPPPGDDKPTAPIADGGVSATTPPPTQPGDTPPPGDGPPGVEKGGTPSPQSLQAESLGRLGMESFARSDFKKAQRQMEKAIALCSRDQKRAAVCTPLIFELASKLGQLHEQQREWPEAMSEYQRVLALSPQVKGKAGIKDAAQQAVQRLSPRLGQVLVSKRGKHACQQETIWMSPGSHSIKVDGKFAQIEVKAREVVKVGSCN